MDELLKDELAALIERTEELRVQLQNCADELYQKKLKTELEEAINRTIELQACAPAFAGAAGSFRFGGMDITRRVCGQAEQTNV